MRMNITKFQSVFENRSFLVDVLTIFFGIGTWIGVNSLWIQLPLLVNVLPEQWFLASYLVIIIQVANLGPITYSIIQRLCPIHDSIFIYFLLALGVAIAFSMAFFYDITAFVFGAERSVAFFSFVFFFALIGCTSSVLFMPYCGRLRDIYLITYLIGEGLSGLLPGVLGLIQGVGGNAQCIPNKSDIPGAPNYVEYFPPARFSTQTFFIIISSLFIASLIAFILLDQLSSVRKEYANVTISHGNKYEYDDKIQTENQERASDEVAESSKPEETIKKLSESNYHGLLVLLGIICMFTNAIVPSVMPFGTLPYGNVTYHLAVTLSSIANPIACFIAVFLTGTSIRNIITLSFATLPFVIYSMTTSVMSPTPPLMGTVIGEFLVVSVLR
jgi:riboflavin transporter 2